MYRLLFLAVCTALLLHFVHSLQPVILSEEKFEKRVQAESACEERGGTVPTFFSLERRNLESGFSSCKCAWAFRGQLVQVGCHKKREVIEQCTRKKGKAYRYYCQIPEPETTFGPTRCVIKKRWPAILTEEATDTLREAEQICKEFPQGRLATQVALQRRNQNQGFSNCECGWAFKGKLVNVGCEGEGVIRECERDHRKSYRVYCLGDITTTTKPETTTTETTTAEATTPETISTESTTTETTTDSSTTKSTTTSTEKPTTASTTTETPEVTEETTSGTTYPPEVIDGTIVKAYKPVANVFHIGLNQGHYLIKNAEQAEILCEMADGKLATPEQMERAWKAGMDNCFCGWLSTGEVRYPINVLNKPQCATSVTVATCPEDYTTMNERGWDAYCYSEAGSFRSGLERVLE